MIEPIMYVAIGFLIACMLIVGLIPIVHARAVRLTTRRIESMTPMSMAEIQADKDQLRAEFAMSTRRLEMSVEQMKAKTTGQLAEIGKKSETIGRMKIELGEKAAALFALEAKEKQLTEDLQEARQQHDERTAALQEAERLLAETRADVTALTASLDESTSTIDSQRVELVTLRAQVEVLQSQIANYDTEARELHEHVAGQNGHAETSRRLLAEETAKSRALAARVGELEREIVTQATEAEALARRVQELMAQIDEQGRFLTDRESTSDTLRNEFATAQQTVLDLRHELAQAEDRQRAAIALQHNDRSALENQLRQSQDERTRLHAEIASMKRDAETTWASERMENAVLRERINDVAAEVARLTSVLEGPGSPIEAMLASEDTPRVPLAPSAHSRTDARHTNGTINGEASRGSLADRIRALQSRASQIPQPSRA